MRRSLSTLLGCIVATAAFTPVGATAQAPLDGVLAAIRNGGGWVAVDVHQGIGAISTTMLPTLGMNLSGCVHVFEGQTGHWEVRARDTIGEGSLEASLDPGGDAPFAHQFGLRARLEFEFEWSEPRDTTLYLWVGVDRADDAPGESCTPKA